MLRPYAAARIASINTRATSGGGSVPARSSSRTFVPLNVMWCARSCGQERAEAMLPHARQKNVCSNLIGVIARLPGAGVSNSRWASVECKVLDLPFL